MNFQILGPFKVIDEYGHVVELGGAKPAALLAMLVLHAKELVPADRLIEDLWDGQPPATAPKTLQVHVSRLRRALPEGVIHTTSGGYVLNAEPEHVDAMCFESLVADGTAALAEGAHARASSRLRSALALWRGEALADFAYASFAQDAIARLDGLRTVALESVVEAELALGRHAELIPEIKALVKRHPLSEHLHAQLMLALYRSGRQAEALGVYRAARRVLVDQLGIEPSEELRELERRILEQDPELAAPSRPAPQRSARADSPGRGVLVGYENELRSLEDALEQALVRQGRLALIAGEPGVGKTRLSDELASVAQARGAQVVWGRCWSGGGAPAYWPWIQVLRALAGDRAAPLRELVPGVDGHEHFDAEEARFQLFDATASVILGAAATQPLVIVLDDLHSADPASLSLLEFIASAALDAPVLMVGTYRDTEEALTQPLRDALSGLSRTTDYLPLVLTGLSAEDTAHFVELSAGVAPMPSLTAAIHEASEGNPLFVSELVRLLRTEDRLRELQEGDKLVLPRGVEQVIARRVEHLGDGCRRTLALAAVVGREFQVEVLERAGDAHGDELLGQLDAARGVRVIEERPVLRFTHDLVRQTLYGALGQSDRRRMHAAVGEALEQVPDTEMAEIAHHFTEALPAGDPVKAVKYLTLAGEDAAELGASDDAAAYYERAAEIGQAGGLDAATLCELYVRVAEQHVSSLDIAQSPAAIERAEAFLAEAPDPARANRLAVARAYGRMLDAFALEDEEIFAAIDFFEQRQDHAGAARAWLALEYVNCGRSRRLESGQAAERMLECSRLAGSKQLIGNAIRYIAGTAALGAGTTSDGIRRLRALRSEAPDAITEARVVIAIAFLDGCRRHFDEARALFGEAVGLATNGRERAEIESFVWTRSAHLETLAGNYARAEESARRAVADLERQGLIRYLSSELMLLADALTLQGKLEEAEFHIDRGAPMAAPDDADAQLRQARSRGRLEFARGALESAEHHMRVALTHMEEAQAPDEHAQTLLDLALILQAQGRADEARAAAADALRVAEGRENLVFADRARALLGAQSAVALAD